MASNGNGWTRALESTADLVLQVDSRFSIVRVNRAVEKFLGKKAKQLVGRKCHEMVHGTPKPIRGCPFIKAKKSHKRESMEFKAGGKWLLIAVDPIINDGKVVGAIHIIRDITERKKAEEALRDSEEKFKSLVENAPNIIMVVGRDGTIVFANRVVAGLTMKNVIGSKLYEYIPRRYHDKVRGSVTNVFRKGKAGSYEIEGVGPNGSTAYYYTQVGPIKAGGKVVAVMQITTDITERKKAEDELREAYEKLKTLDELKTDFVQTVSHELRTPITSMRLACDLMDKEELPPEIAETQEIIRRNTARMERTVNTILNFTAVESGRVKFTVRELDVNRAVVEVAGSMRGYAESKRLKLKAELGSPPKVKSDGFWVGVVLQNIVENAIKFTDRGSVTITTEGEGNGAAITVRDTGIGLSKSDMEKVLNKFEKVYPHKEGSGIGFWTAKRVMEELGGSIAVSSKGRGKGTTVELRLPSRRK